MTVLTLDLPLHEVHGRGPDKSPDKAVGREVIDDIGFIVLLDLPILHHRDMVAHAQRFDLIVGDIDGRGFDLLQQPLELRAHLQAQQSIQVAERLIHEQHFGTHGDCPRHRHTLALTATHLTGIAVKHVLDVQQRRGIMDALVDLILIELVHLQSEGDIVIHGHMREDCIALEDHRDLALARRQIGHIPPADANPPLVRHAQAGNRAQQGGLPASAGTQQDYKFLVLNGHAYVVYSHKFIKAFGYVFDSNVCHVDLLFGNLSPHVEQIAPDVEDKDQGRDHHEETARKLVGLGRLIESHQHLGR